MIRERGTKVRHCWRLAPPLLLAAVTVAALGARPATFTVRGSDGSVSCVVSPVDDAALVDVRAPGVPAAELLATLPPDRRDFSVLPTRVVLLGQALAGAASVERRPSSLAAALEYPIIDGAPSAEPFVRATFPRAWLVGGTTVLAERMVAAPDGTRVTSQTRCAIADADAAQWR